MLKFGFPADEHEIVWQYLFVDRRRHPPYRSSFQMSLNGKLDLMDVEIVHFVRDIHELPNFFSAMFDAKINEVTFHVHRVEPNWIGNRIYRVTG